MITDEPERLAVQGAVLAAAGVALFPLAGALLRWLVDERARFFARWGFSHVAIAALAGVVAAVGIAQVMPPPAEAGVLDLLHGSAAIMLVVVAFAAGHARRLAPEGLRGLGFPRDAEFPAWRAVVGALLAYACVLPVIYGLEAVWPVLRDWLELSAEASTLPFDVAALEGGRFWWALALCILVVPALEELAFRGYLQPLLVQNFSEKGGIAVTAVLFAALHGAYAFLPLFALALVLGVAKVRTQRLIAPYAIHALHNALVLLIAIRFPELGEPIR